jgi:hypothetical protein
MDTDGIAQTTELLTDLESTGNETQSQKSVKKAEGIE